jgi:hypothetical protein
MMPLPALRIKDWRGNEIEYEAKTVMPAFRRDGKAPGADGRSGAPPCGRDRRPDLAMSGENPTLGCRGQYSRP